MDYHSLKVNKVLTHLKSDMNGGLTQENYALNIKQYGKNILSKGRKKSFWSKLVCALKEPMLIILLFSFALAFSVSIGKYLKTGTFDFEECLGILSAVVLSVTITLIMERSSEKAFEELNKIGDKVKVKVVRNGNVLLVDKSDVSVGDVVLIESGDKIIADGRVIYSNQLKIDESALTGESNSVKKQADIVLDSNVPLAERCNCVYSGTFVTNGNGKMVVTAVGDNTEIGGIASEIKVEKESVSPLEIKLAKLGKTITVIGIIVSVFVFVLSLVRQAVTVGLTFDSVQEMFVECIILIVAAVPEGLPTIIAVSLALNMIKLAKSNALIKKMTATETAGAVSVICTDKTGTLTLNQMTVNCVCKNESCQNIKDKISRDLLMNFVCNSTSQYILKNKKEEILGDATECALLKFLPKKKEIISIRNNSQIIERVPFSSDKKYMITRVNYLGNICDYIKGSPEKVLEKCNLTQNQKIKIELEMKPFRNKAKRVICFAHKEIDNQVFDEQIGNYIYDGFAVLSDGIRPEVYKSVEKCKRAGIKVKILTGDNRETALAIARELKIANNDGQVVNAYDLEMLSDSEIKNILPKITVIARSTPQIKLKIVRLLKELGEVVAVTGDGINDAPAIKHADIGFAMGKTGSEISRESADVVLLDDSFDTIVKTVSFGRNVYRNLQRFIMFQLSVNVSAMIFITVCAIFGFPAPFNTLELLWINIIMDGPPALTLGLGREDSSLMQLNPVKKDKSIVTSKMLGIILFNGVFSALLVILQYFTNFLCVKETEMGATIFSVFVLTQLFNAFNCTKLGKESIFSSIGKNKIMLVTFVLTLIIHIFIVQVAYGLFGISPLSFESWLKSLAVSSLIVVITEGYRFVFRRVEKTNLLMKKTKNNKKA